MGDLACVWLLLVTCDNRHVVGVARVVAQVYRRRQHKCRVASDRWVRLSLCYSIRGAADAESKDPCTTSAATRGKTKATEERTKRHKQAHTASRTPAGDRKPPNARGTQNKYASKRSRNQIKSAPRPHHDNRLEDHIRGRPSSTSADNSSSISNANKTRKPRGRR